MNTKKVITAGLLVICWALVFFIISSDEVAGADYNNDINEVISANDAKEFLDELEYVLGVFEEAGMKSGKQIDLTPILFTYNICWLINKARQFLQESEEKSDWYERFKEIVYELLQEMEDLNTPEIDSNFTSNEGDMLVDLNFPFWYYYFAGVNSDSYIEVTYSDDNQEGLVPGSIEFASGRFNVLWNVRSGKTQRFYLACYLDVKSKMIPNPMPIGDANLFLLRSYWSKIEEDFEEATDSFNLYRFCESWYCDSDDDFCILKCRLSLGLPSLVDGDVGEDFGDNWERSPLLMLTPSREKWGRSQDNFTTIVFTVDENTGREVRFDGITIVLNDEPIATISGSRAVAPRQPLPLFWDIYFGRRDRAELDDIANIPPSLRNLLEAAAKNIGLAWRFGCPYSDKKGYDNCGYKWELKEFAPSVEAWRPIPHEWCGDFVKEMIRKYTDLPKPEADEHLWLYFGRLDASSTGEYRISPVDINPATRQRYRWEDLATVLKPGYAVMTETVQKRTPHALIFLEWIEAPRPGSCRATFRTIAGNESMRVKARLRHWQYEDNSNLYRPYIIYNGSSECGGVGWAGEGWYWAEELCDEYDEDGAPTEQCTFFGRTERR